MANVPRWRRYLRLFGPDVKADVRDELEFHLDAKTRELSEESGISLEEARRQALAHFGDVGEVSDLCRRISEEDVRRSRGRETLEGWWQDLRLAVRALRRAPWFVAASVLTLAAGIAGAASLFSMIDSWIVRAVRFERPEELVWARSFDTRRGREAGVSPADYADLAAASRQLESLAAWSFDSFTISREGEPERVRGSQVSTNFFATLRVRPLLGRDFVAREGEFGNHRVAIVSHGFWKARLNGSERAVGSVMHLNGEPHVVVGVLPERMHFTLTGRANIWTPLAPSPEERARRQDRYLQMVGRMKPGVSLVQVQEELKGLSAKLAMTYPQTNQDVGSYAILLSDEVARHTGRDVILVVFGASLGLLLIACSNVASLLLVRALSRQRQSAIQVSLGASRGRLVRQSLVETLVVFLLAALVGGVGGWWATETITQMVPFENRGYLPDYGAAPFSWAVFGFVLATTLLTAILFGLAPSLEATKGSVLLVLKESGSAVSQSVNARRLRMWLVVGQVVLATVVLSSTVVLVETFRAMWSGPLGFQSSGVLSLRLSLDRRVQATPEQRRRFFESVEDGVAGVGEGVLSSVCMYVPFGKDQSATNFRLIGDDATAGLEEKSLPRAFFNAVGPNFFAVLRTPVLSGRAFNRRDVAERPLVAIISDGFAKRHFAGQNPIGRSVVLGRLNNRPAEIVGVVGEIRQGVEWERGSAQVYVPFAQLPGLDGVVIARGADAPSALVPQARRVIGSLDRNLPLYDVKSMDQRLDEDFSPFRIISGMLVWFGALALILAAVGVYGVLAFSVSQRTREIGIRAALGADRRQLYLLFLRQGGMVLAAGLIPGLVLGFAALTGLRSVLADMLGMGGIGWPLAFSGLLVGGVILFGTLVPARRGASVDPLAAIRHE